MLPIFLKTLTCIRAIKHTLSFSALATELTEQNIQSHPKGGNRSMQQTSCIVCPCSPIPHNLLARALMPRQPYSEAVKSDVSVPYKGNRRGRKDY